MFWGVKNVKYSFLSQTLKEFTLLNFAKIGKKNQKNKQKIWKA